MNEKNKIKRNLTIFIIGVLTMSMVGGIITANVNEIGGLIFIISPILMMILLRSFGGDGWKDAGLRLKLRESWRWYLFSLFAYPITIFIAIVVGALLGVTSLNGSLNELLPLFVAGIAAQFVPRMIFALFEEWGWRGYMEPRLTAFGMPDLRRHLFVGLIWGIWHFPFIFSTDYTDISYAIFVPLFMIGIAFEAIVYGQMRKGSGTVWTSVLMHGVANTILWAIIENNLLVFNDKVFTYPTPESLLMILLWAGLSWLVLRQQKKRFAQAALPQTQSLS